ncbi:MAG: GDSL-type esterase/lipase family protein [Hydrogenimonas sp.]|nr:GDSL-type esterase/lipase family protein [Hydrogenimonas sp.]
MKISKLELIAIIIVFFVGFHFYNQHKLESDIAGEEHLATLFYDIEKPPVIVAFGDSLTYGTGARYGGVDMSYPAQLSKLIGVEVINEGVPGETAQKGIARLQKVLKQYRPVILILCEGGNDMLRSRKLADLKKDLKEMIDMAIHSGSKVILLGVPEPKQLFLRDAKLYGELADETGVIYLKNIFSDVLSDNSLTKDPAHPNAKGYAIIAKRIAETIRGGI